MPSGRGSSSRGSSSHFGGSRGSSSSSHFGGSRGSSSHFGGSRSSMGNVSYRPSFYLFNNSNNNLKGGTKVVYSILLIVLFFVISAFFNNINGIKYCKQSIEEVEYNYAYYQNMVLQASNNATYQRSAKVIRYEYNPEYDNKARLIYEIDIESPAGATENLSGYTFYTYSLEQAENLVGSNILVAIDTTKVTEYTDSVDFVYLQTSLKDDGEYVYITKLLNNKIFTQVVLVIISIALIITIIKIIKKHSKNESDKISLNNNNNINNQSTTSTTKPHLVCKYCGSEMPKDESKCTNCGASLKS